MIDTIDLITIFFAIATSFAALWSAIFIQGRFSSNMDLRVKSLWAPPPKKFLKLIIEVENLGFMKVGIEKILLEVEEYKYNQLAKPGDCIGKEWIDFKNAEHILATTLDINPKETLHVERLYIAGKGRTLHVGIQAHFKYPWYMRLLGKRATTLRQTRTFYISRDFKSDDSHLVN